MKDKILTQHCPNCNSREIKYCKKFKSTCLNCATIFDTKNIKLKIYILTDDVDEAIEELTNSSGSINRRELKKTLGLE